MPTYAELMAKGVKGDNGLVQAFPPNTGVGWYTLATGAYPGEHGSTNNTFFRTGDRVQQPHGGLLERRAPGRHHRRIRRAGRQEGRIGRVGRRVPDDHPAARPGRRLSQLLLQPRPVDQLGCARSACRRERLRRPVPALRPGQTRRLEQRANELQHGQTGHFDIGATARSITNDQYDFYVYDSTNDGIVNYDEVLIVPNADGKDGWRGRRRSGRGEWADVKVTLANPAGKTGGFYVKAMLFAPDLCSSASSSPRSPAPSPPATAAATPATSRRPQHVVPELDGRRLCRVRVGAGGRRHLRRAGPEVERRPLGLPASTSSVRVPFPTVGGGTVIGHGLSRPTC